MSQVALYYDDSGYQETLQRPARVKVGSPVGLMGRQVAGKEFLDAYLTHGQWEELLAVVHGSASARSLTATCRQHASSRDKVRRLRMVQTADFCRDFLPDPPGSPLYFPCPPDTRYAWARQHAGGSAYALCGVTHTLCSLNAVQALGTMVTAPYEPFDRLICTSRAVIDMVRRVTETYADYLRDRFGGTPQLRAGLECIPLGVNPSKFKPATAEARAAARARFHIREDETVVLFVGRLAHHAKAHPFPMYRGLALAARRTGQPVHLLLSGWAANPAVADAFEAGAREFAPGVRVTAVDGTRAENRFAVWDAADLFTSLSDNIQETFGLVIIEAMACGLPVVASDWDGYRDLAVDGETGYLAPTRMVRDATHDLTVSLLTGELGYDHFLARSNQAVAVDVAAAADAYARLIESPELRSRMGAAGRARVEAHFDWARIIPRYETLWREQEEQRGEFAASRQDSAAPGPTPTLYPPPEDTFACYPTEWCDAATRLQAVADAEDLLTLVCQSPLTNYAENVRLTDRNALELILQTAADGATLGELTQVAGCDRATALATLAWMVKYDLLRTEGD